LRYQGGFSYVYLVQDNSNQQLLALKKIRCPFGQESVSLALKEVEAYTLFSPHPNIIHSIDYSVETDKSDASAKTVYILLPYYRRGNLQDMINANLVNHTKFPERRLMVLFLGVCKALKAMHQYKVKGGPGGARSEQKAKKVRREAARADAEAAAAENMEMRPSRKHREHDDDDEQEAEGLLEESEVTMAQEGVAPGGERAYAHRDIKPGMSLTRLLFYINHTNIISVGNIMIDDDGKSPILMDLGSLAPSPTPITSRSLALQVQDLAAEHSTMPYRAPELFDVKTGSVIDTKVDIWSLGCTLYACLVGKSPFEFRSDETGGSLSICVLGGDWRFPDEGPQRGKAKQTEEMISEPVKEVVRKCLMLEPSERPDVDELISIVEELLQSLPEDGAED
jgi:serine/threonine kinase 16